MREKLGDWILDVAKYLLTVGILAPMLKVGYFATAYYYTALVGIVVILVIIGLNISDDDKDENNKNKRRR